MSIFTDQEIQTLSNCMANLNEISQRAMEIRIAMQHALDSAIQRAAEAGQKAEQDSADPATKPK